MASSVIHNGRVYQWKSHNKWKEQWLCLEENGYLVWKRKDAYQVKGSIELNQHLSKVFLPSPTNKQLEDDQHPYAYFFSVPMKLLATTNDKKLVRKLFAVFHLRDLELWLDAMATSVGQRKVYKAVCDRHRQRVAKSKHCSVDHVEEFLTHHEAIPFLRTIWDEFLVERKNPMALQEISESMCQKSLSAALIFREVDLSHKSESFEYPRSRISSTHSDFSDYVTTSGSEDEICIDFSVKRKSIDSGVQSFSGFKVERQIKD